MKSAKISLNSLIILVGISPVGGLSMAISFKTISLVTRKKENYLILSLCFLMDVILGCCSNNSVASFTLSDSGNLRNALRAKFIPKFFTILMK